MDEYKYEIINGRKVYYENNKRPFVYDKSNKTKSGFQKKRVYIKYCKKCGKKFYTRINTDFCSSSCSKCYNDITDIREFNNKNVYTDENNNYFIIINNKNHKRYGYLCVCNNCGKIFFRTKNRIDYSDNLFCSRHCQGKYFSKKYIGENNPCWRGGNTSLSACFRTEIKYYDWRTSCMARDNFICQKCGKRGGMLNVHHIKHVSDIFKEYNIKTRDDYMNCKELWNMDNGITLCEECHKNEHKRLI